MWKKPTVFGIKMPRKGIPNSNIFKRPHVQISFKPLFVGY